METTISIIAKFCTVIETTKYSPWISKYATNRFKMADGRHLENPIKFPDFKNPKWQTAALFKIEKNTISQ